MKHGGILPKLPKKKHPKKNEELARLHETKKYKYFSYRERIKVKDG